MSGNSEVVERVARGIYEVTERGVFMLTWEEAKARTDRVGFAHAKTAIENAYLSARAAIKAIEPVDVRCPFCGEDGFDKIGLKIHLHWCAAYEEMPLADPPEALSPSLKEQEDRT